MAVKNRRTLELKLGKLGLILFVSGISALLFSMFLLGILVGRHMDTYSEKYSAGMTDLIYDRLFASSPQRGGTPPLAEAAAKSEPAAGEEDFGLTFYDTLAGTKRVTATVKKVGAVKDTPPVSAPPKALTGKHEMSALAAVSADTTTENRDLPVPDGKGDGKKKTSLPEKRAATESGAKVAAVPPVGGGTTDGKAALEKGRFEIQVAAYQESWKAEQVMGKLSPLGFSAKMVMKELPGKGTWFRVIIGGFENREKAKAAADRIAGKIRGVKCVIRSSGKNGGN